MDNILFRTTRDGRAVIRFRDIPSSSHCPLVKHGEDSCTEQGWATFGSGLNGECYAIVEGNNNDVFLAGAFTGTHDGQVESFGLVRYNTFTREFSPMGKFKGTVDALAFGNGILYAGGTFTAIGDVSYNFIAQWNGVYWSPLGTAEVNGFDSYCYTLLYRDSKLYAGGNFAKAGNLDAGSIAVWNGTSWENLNYGFNAPVYALAFYNGMLYAGGSMTLSLKEAITTEITPVRYIARYNFILSRWESVGYGVDGNSTPACYALVADQNALYIGGSFNRVGGIEANNLVKCVSTTTTTVDNITTNTTTTTIITTDTFTAMGKFSDEVLALALSAPSESTSANSVLYAGGYFTDIDGEDARYIAKISPQSTNPKWSFMSNGLNGPCRTVVPIGTTIFAGGTFQTAGKSSAYYVAELEGDVWRPLGNGIARNSIVSGLTFNGAVRKVVKGANKDLYIGGTFTSIGSHEIRYIAKWSNDGRTWSQVGNLNLPVNSLFYADGQIPALYAGTSYGVYRLTDPANATLGTAWAQLSTDTENVKDLVYADSNLYFIGGTSVYRIENANTAGILSSRVKILSNTAQSFAYVGGQTPTLYVLGGQGVHSITNLATRNESSEVSTFGPPISNGSSILYASAPSPILYVGTSTGVVNRPISANEQGWTVVGPSIANVLSLEYDATNSTLFSGTSHGVYRLSQNTEWIRMTSFTGEVSSVLYIDQSLYLATNSQGVLNVENPTTVSSSIAAKEIDAHETDGQAVIRTIVRGDCGCIYVGGGFTSVGGVHVRNIAEWDPRTKKWQGLGAGTDTINVALFHDGVLYVGGEFGVMRWASDTWQKVGSTTLKSVFSLAIQPGSPSFLYAGGTFADRISRIENPKTATGPWGRVGDLHIEEQVFTITSLFFIPGSPFCLFAGASTTSTTLDRLFKIDNPASVSNGQNWTAIPLQNKHDILCMTGLGRNIYIGTTEEVIKYDTITSNAVNLGEPRKNVYALAFDSNANLYAGTDVESLSENGFFKLPRDSNSWEHVSGPTPIGTRALYFDDAFDTLYIGSDSRGVLKDIYVSSIYTHSIPQSSGKVEALGISLSPITNNPGKTEYANSTIWHNGTSFVFGNTTKTFVINHPQDKDRLLVHACLEGPEAGVYYRGKSIIPEGKDSVHVFLPKYTKDLSRDFTVTATPLGPVVGFGASEVDPETQSFTVYGPAGTRFHWMAIGMRQEIEVEPLTNTVQVQGNGPYRWIQ